MSDARSDSKSSPKNQVAKGLALLARPPGGLRYLNLRLKLAPFRSTRLNVWCVAVLDTRCFWFIRRRALHSSPRFVTEARLASQHL